MGTAISFAILSLVLGGALFGLVSDRRLRRELGQPFSPAKWQQVEIRWKLLNDLLHSDRLAGMRLQQALQLLGPPDDDQGRVAAYFHNSQHATYRHLAYRLSSEEDCDWLVLHVDETDRIVDFSQLLGW